ncbi:hypothetical protein GCM10023321_31840 [Pseudonocardia eucalypti]|uniref:DUF3040 domain-containing protein n=1 Tax=Pseudonocardia eucalypti TaxID=648755 RepID=A0ABP9Q7L4_9PSEU|nr:hypothetical protein [Pseudonocardia eucalypti]
MTAALPPEPRKPAPLTPSEQCAFADITDRLAGNDTNLAASTAQNDAAHEDWVPIRLGLPALFKPVALRTLTLAVLGLAVVLTPAAWWSVLALSLVMFGLPCLVLFLIDRENRA